MFWSHESLNFNFAFWINLQMNFPLNKSNLNFKTYLKNYSKLLQYQMVQKQLRSRVLFLHVGKNWILLTFISRYRDGLSMNVRFLRWKSKKKKSVVQHFLQTFRYWVSLLYFTTIDEIKLTEELNWVDIVKLWCSFYKTLIHAQLSLCWQAFKLRLTISLVHSW